jgi:hypothetical protein
MKRVSDMFNYTQIEELPDYVPWGDIYTAGYHKYVTGEREASNAAIVEYQILAGIRVLTQGE